jgi:ABC-2 type transport system ATP-binding protein
VIRASGLTRGFRNRTAVDQVDLDVPAGCAFSLLGVNGARKTTLIRMLLGLTPARSGKIWLLGLGVPVQRAHALRDVVAIVEQPRFHRTFRT